MEAIGVERHHAQEQKRLDEFDLVIIRCELLQQPFMEQALDRIVALIELGFEFETRRRP